MLRRGQSIVEYTIIIGIVTIALYYMSIAIKRGVQSLVKVTADQVGSQQNADQDFQDNRQGYMNFSDTYTQDLKNRQMTEAGYYGISGTPHYFGNTGFNDYTYTTSNTITNGGFQADQ